MRKREETSTEDEDSGVRRTDLVNWYLKEVESEIDSEQELIDKKMLVEKVIFRLVHHDHVLISLDQTGLTSKKRGGEGDEVKEDDPILVVHPNYVIDS